MIRTAVDSSVLLDVFAADSVHGEVSLRALQIAWNEGSLVACEVVWAEIRPRFEKEGDMLAATEKIQLGYDFLQQAAALKAGKIFKKYRSGGGKKERMIPDFLIGAHAALQADRLLTRDRGFYRSYFSDLKIFEP
ncbi:MAG TPA: VapC toxin family PIN domain ribonuclease [Deltaproteobacteria bacterium]|nr:VapC toxin family PIN domain ribonuclease [Deltaproteobacteria bacterium]